MRNKLPKKTINPFHWLIVFIASNEGMVILMMKLMKIILIESKELKNCILFIKKISFIN